MFRLRVLSLDEPVADAPYEVLVDGQRHRRKTDADGMVELAISPKAKTAKLMIPSYRVAYAVVLGGLDPVDEIVGVQERLTNLGFRCGALDGQLWPRFKGIRLSRKRVEGAAGPLAGIGIGAGRQGVVGRKSTVEISRIAVREGR